MKRELDSSREWESDAEGRDRSAMSAVASRRSIRPRRMAGRVGPDMAIAALAVGGSVSFAAAISYAVSAGVADAILAAGVTVQGAALVAVLIGAVHREKTAARLPRSIGACLALCVLIWTSSLGLLGLKAIAGVLVGNSAAGQPVGWLTLVDNVGRLLFVGGLWVLVRRAGRIPLSRAGLPVGGDPRSRRRALMCAVGYALALLVSQFLLIGALTAVGAPVPTEIDQPTWASWMSLLAAGVAAGPYEELLFAAVPVMIFSLVRRSPSAVGQDSRGRRWAVSLVLLVLFSGIYRGIGHLRYANPTSTPPEDLTRALSAAAAVMLWGMLWGGVAVLLMARFGRVIPLMVAHSASNTEALFVHAPNATVQVGVVLVVMIVGCLAITIPVFERPRSLYTRANNFYYGDRELEPANH
jgi:membrane protease YdiL (CAAX protease family)